MKQSIILKLKLLVVFVFMVGNMSAQQKLTKVSQKIKVDKDVTIDLNTSNCDIVFDTWNKNEVSIEAYIESDELSKEELQATLKNWDVNVNGSSNLVSISSKANATNSWDVVHSDGNDHIVEVVLGELKYELAEMPEMNFNFVMSEMPEMPEMPNMPELPELPEGTKNFYFDYGAYKKDGEMYLEEYTKKFESTFGKDYAKKMEAWGEKFGKEFEEKYGKDYAKKMEAYGERLAEKIKQNEGRIEAYVARIEDQKENREDEKKKELEERLKVREERAKERSKLSEERRVKIGKLIHGKSDSKAKKTIIIKMPKDSKLKLNVKHGELKLTSVIDNINAELYYSKLLASSINGSTSSINASYSTLNVTNWNLGSLDLKYVKKAEINNVKRLMLNSKSSDISIGNLINSAIINGSIGTLTISKIDDSFNNLNITIENSDAIIELPHVNYNLQYTGNRSRFSHPEKVEKNNVSTFSTGDLSSPKTIVVNAKYSNVVMQ